MEYLNFFRVSYNFIDLLLKLHNVTIMNYNTAKFSLCDNKYIKYLYRIVLIQSVIESEILYKPFLYLPKNLFKQSIYHIT